MFVRRKTVKKILTYNLLFLVIFTVKIAVAEELPPSGPTNTDLKMCKVDAAGYIAKIARQLPMSAVTNNSSISLEYLNAGVTTDYIKMTDSVSHHVAVSVAMSLFSFDSGSLSAENIVSHISMGTQPFLPFIFANGVEITSARAEGRTIVYRTQMPISKTHKQAKSLALAGRISTVAYVCNNAAMVDDLLKRHIVIQYDYFDLEGDFVSSFTINGGQTT